jgi:glycosyltransferase involved in cell wall biosynthesis
MANIVHWGKYYPPDMGGIESVTASLALGAAAAGHRVTVLCFSKIRMQELDYLPGGVKVLRAPIALLKASQPLGWRYWRWALREGRVADVVHLHAPNMLAALAGVCLGRGPKLMVHWHSDLVGKGWLGRLLKPLERALLTRADKIVCTSQAYADASLTLKLFVDKVVVVPIGVADAAVSDDLTDEALPEALQARLLGRRVVLAVGRLVPYKAFHVLVEAAMRLPPDVVVVIVGTGPLHADLQERIDAACVAEQVVLAGRQSDAALRALFRRAALFCLPSAERSEAFGVVLIEAMSHRLPVVATQITGSGVPWVNAQGVSGLNVPVNDAWALAAACNQILSSDELRRELANGARTRFEHEFTEQVTIDRMLAVYDSLLDTES